MVDWNLVVSVQAHGFRRAFEALRGFGEVHKTDYYNVVTLHVPDPAAFPSLLQRAFEADPSLPSLLARVMPIERTFGFQNAEEFEHRACQVVADWLGRLHGHSFHVRMHRRGFKERIRSQHEEQFLDHWLLEQLSVRGQPGRITFEDPDYIIALETVGQRAGVSIWDRDERKRYPFLKLD